MPLVKDFNKYLIGVELADKHHRNLIEIINELYDKLLKGAPHNTIRFYLERLDLYVNTHFKAEEELMIKVKYPEYESHKQIHEGFINELAKLRLQSEESSIGKELVIYLVTWLTEHILKVDRKYAIFLDELKKGWLW